MSNSITRRDILKTLTAGVVAGSVLRAIPAHAAEYAHKMVQAEKASAGGVYAPKFFNPHQYKTLQSLCNAIIPPDDRSGGAVEADRPGRIYLLPRGNKAYPLSLGWGTLGVGPTLHRSL